MKPVPSWLAGLLVAACASAHAVQLVRWERLPLAVPLVVGQERVVFLDHSVRVRLPASLDSRLRIQSAGDTVYLRASEPIAPTRLELQDVDSGQVIFLDVSAEAAKAGQPTLEPMRIVEAAPPGAPQKDDDRASVAVPAPDTPVPVVLTRYAAQSLYAPLRTVEPVAGIARVNVRRDLALDTLMPALPVRLRAMAAWRLADEWVTAILLTNTSPHDLSLDPRLLQGDFVAAAFQHPSLGPAGQSTDTTVAYLVTHGHGLAESLLPAISRIDATVNLPLTAGSETMEGPRDEK